ncbi:MAG: putative integral rane protein [Acidimicrobiia bacterium]|nr:putative integral rane protein [Acidimicrobiia bacterium]
MASLAKIDFSSEGDVRNPWPLLAPIVAGSLAVAAAVFGWHGGDLPAQIYRIGLFHRQGLTLWDSQWYGGHWTLNYSVLLPVVAGWIGVQATAVVAATAAAAAFDRVVTAHFGRAGRAGSIAFAVGTLVQTAIGQLPFLLGEAFAVTAFLAATRRRWPVAVALALGASLSSPLAGAFLALAMVSWLVGSSPRCRLGLVAVAFAAALPIAAAGLLFPGQGAFPFPAFDFASEILCCVAVVVLIPKQQRQLRVAAAIYAIVVALTFVVPSPVGGNISRLGECLGLPVVICVLWPRRRLVLAAIAVPLVLAQWTPALAAVAHNAHDPSTRTSYYQPLLTYLQAHASPAGRVEVVPTQMHWEAAYVAPAVALARGWERQLDTADNPIFYDRDTLTASSYRAWLLNNGVTYVALPDVALDYAAHDEAALLTSGVTGLSLAWSDTHWKVFAVAGSTGIVEGPAQLERLEGDRVVINAAQAAPIRVRIRYTPKWSVVSGDACTRSDSDGWTVIDAHHVGRIELALRLVSSAGTHC